MNATILNREFKHPIDGWYHIEPKGEHRNTAAGVVQVIDDPSVEAIVNRFNQDAAAGRLSHGHEMLIDREHFSHDPDKETTAYGWLQRLQGREDGIYAQIRWTATGQAAVDGGDLRFFSTEYNPDECEPVHNTAQRSDANASQGAGSKTLLLRPRALAGLTLTNRPNNRGGKPITNRGGNAAASDAGEQAQTTKTKTEYSMKLIASALGLQPEASEETILGELNKLKNRATEAEAKVAPLTEQITLLTNRMTTMLDEQIAADLDGHGVKDEAVRNKLIPVLKPMANRQERVDFLKLMQPPVAEKKETPAPITNRSTAKAPNGGSQPTDDDAADARKVALITNRANELRKQQPGLSHATAMIMAQREAAGA